jgi:citrate synthase
MAFNQLLEIRNFVTDNASNVAQFVELAKQRNARIMGLGHRVYKSYDPRATIAKRQALKLMELGYGDEQLFKNALELEEIVLSDDYFTSRSLYPNIDFWTALVYHAIGFEPQMFTPIFAMSRIPGWIAHWREMHQDPLHKIGRPRQVYTGSKLRNFIPFEERV